MIGSSYSVEQWFSDNTGGAWRGLAYCEATAQFEALSQDLAADERILLFAMSGGPGRSGKDLVAQAWVDHHGETQRRVTQGYSLSGFDNL